MDEKSSLTRNDLEQSLADGDLTYLARNSSSVVIERTSKRMYADNQTYGTSDKNMGILFQTGVDYIDGKNSYLRFQLAITKTAGAGAVNFGHGTALNLIEKVKITSRSGVILGLINKVNLLQYYEMKYNNSESWFGSNIDEANGGLGIAGGMLAYSNRAAYDLGNVEINIPLALIHPFFDQHNLLPSVICKGLRIDITLADANTAFKIVDAGTSVTYAMSGVWVSLDSYRLSDDAMRKLNDMSREKEGLILQYYEWENSNFNRPSGVTSLSVEVRKSVSMANSAFAVTRNTAFTTDKQKDSFLAVEVKEDQYQWRAGSMYFPQTALSGVRSWYSNVNYCKGNLKSRAQPFVRYFNTLGTEPTFSSTDATTGGSLAIACVDLDRYWLDLSGLSLSNSVTLNLNVVYEAAAVAASVDLFLKHTRRLAIYADNAVVLD